MDMGPSAIEPPPSFSVMSKTADVFAVTSDDLKAHTNNYAGGLEISEGNEVEPVPGNDMEHAWRVIKHSPTAEPKNRSRDLSVHALKAPVQENVKGY